MKPKFLHRDASLVIIHKPAGMTVYKEPGSSDSASALEWVKSKVPGGRCHPVHRLDKGTCGVLVFALDPVTANLMQKLFREGKVEKQYWAIVEGECPERGEFRNPLPEAKTKETRSAITRFRVLQDFQASGMPYSLVEVDPKTGRFHQIRRHFSMNGHPLVGDDKYRGSLRYLKRPALSAIRIQFRHPSTRKAILAETHPDPDFQSLWRKLEGATNSSGPEQSSGTESGSH